jgi:hypothetical protein
VHRAPEWYNVKGRVLFGDLGVDEINTNSRFVECIQLTQRRVRRFAVLNTVICLRVL